MDIRRRIVKRSIVMGIFFIVLILLLLARVFWIQTANAEWLNVRAQKMWERESFVAPKRGTIFDRTGQPLAYDGPSYNVVAVLSKKDPQHVTNPVEAAQKLSPILGMSAERLIQLMSRTDPYQVELRPGGWKISQEKADQIQELAIPGIHLQKNIKRYYQNNAFASHTLGYVDKEGKPQMGIELYYDEILRGEPGKYRFIKDGKNVVMPTGIEDYIPAIDGYDIKLTIDQRIQHFVERALDEAVTTYQPKGISVIVADPKTMEILATSNRPHFNPNEYEKGIEVYLNAAVSNIFEPGSTFKIVTLAAAVEEGLFDPDATYKSGRYSDPYINPPIRDHNNGQGWGEITYLEGVQRSSNVAFVTLGYEYLGKDRLFKYYNDFGFGAKSGVDLPGESIGRIPDPRNTYPRDVAASTFGQGPVAVSAIQQVAAVAAIANGGKLLQPYLLKEVIDPVTGEVIQEQKPTVKKQVISAKTAKEVSRILETVVTSPVGTGRNYSLEEYRVAGKTGTAQKVGSDGKYLEDEYIYSFIGYAPVEDPKLIVYITVEEPGVEVLSGSTIIAPIFKSVMKNSLQYLQVQPKEQAIQEVDLQTNITLPDFVSERTQIAKQKGVNLGLIPEVIGDGEQVIRQYPEPETILDKDSRIYLLTDEDFIAMPDFTGKSLREVLEFSSFIGLSVQVFGTGYITEQSIPAGNFIKEDDALVVYLEPLNPNEQIDMVQLEQFNQAEDIQNTNHENGNQDDNQTPGHEGVSTESTSDQGEEESGTRQHRTGSLD